MSKEKKKKVIKDTILPVRTYKSYKEALEDIAKSHDKYLNEVANEAFMQYIDKHN